MVAIFLGSTSLGRPENSEAVLNPILKVFGITDLDNVRIVLRKVAHVVEYCVLAWLLAYFCLASSRRILQKWWFAFALFGVFVFAASDEWHQSFVPERVASIIDVMLDTASGAVALSLLAGYRLIFRTADD
jgi:VanZ family protein